MTDMQLKKKPGELISMAESVDWRRRVSQTGRPLRPPAHNEEYTDPQERTKRKEHDQLGMTRKKSFSEIRIKPVMMLDTTFN